jgi:hypothetical protein
MKNSINRFTWKIGDSNGEWKNVETIIDVHPPKIRIRNVKTGIEKIGWTTNLATFLKKTSKNINNVDEVKMSSFTDPEITLKRQSVGRFPDDFHIENQNYKKVEDFYLWFQNVNKEKDLHNQKELITNAIGLQKKIETNDELTDGEKKLFQKINHRVNKNGILRTVSFQSILGEILDSNNSSSLWLYQKSPRKQGVEKLQVQFLKEKYNILLLAGKENNLTPNGPNSIRMSKDGELIFGGKKNYRNHCKSFDSKLDEESLVFQKVTTDDGGSTDSVYEEVISTLEACKLYFHKHPDSSYKFIFLLDGPFWERNEHKNLTRRKNLIQIVDNYPQIFICKSNNLFQTLKV